MMRAVLYEPVVDTIAGPIVAFMEGSAASIEATAEELGCQVIEVTERRGDYDTTYHVVGGAVVPKAEH